MPGHPVGRANAVTQGGRGQLTQDLVAHGGGLGARHPQGPPGDSLGFLDEAEEQMLAAHVVVAQLQRLLLSQAQGRLGPGRQAQLTAPGPTLGRHRGGLPFGLVSPGPFHRLLYE